MLEAWGFSPKFGTVKILREETVGEKECRENQERSLAMGILNKFKYYRCNSHHIAPINHLLSSSYDLLGTRESILKDCVLPDTEYLVHFMLFMTRNIAPSPLGSPHRSTSISVHNAPLFRSSQSASVVVEGDSPEFPTRTPSFDGQLCFPEIPNSPTLREKGKGRGLPSPEDRRSSASYYSPHP